MALSSRGDGNAGVPIKCYNLHCKPPPNLHSRAVGRLPPVLVGNSLIGNSELKKAKGKKTHSCVTSAVRLTAQAPAGRTRKHIWN